MKVFISADMEGVSGLVSWEQCSRPQPHVFDYRWARARMIADVNAAIRGARAAGATEVVVKDSHGNGRNLLADELEPGTRLISGSGAGFGGMMTGIDRECTAALLVGYHAMAGARSAVMEHTLTGFVHRLSMNDAPIGEIAISAALAGCFEVPIVMISSDLAGCTEAARLLKGIQTASVKTGIGRFMAESLHPTDAEAGIEEAARKGVELASELDPWHPHIPAKIQLEMHEVHQADAAARFPGVRRLDGYTLEYETDSVSLAFQTLTCLLEMARD